MPFKRSTYASRLRFSAGQSCRRPRCDVEAVVARVGELKATPAAFHMTFLGTQPTFTQVPPRRSGLDHRGLGAVFGGALRAGEAAAAAADADEIECLLGHRELHPSKGPCE